LHASCMETPEHPPSSLVSALLALAEQLSPADRVTLARLLVGQAEPAASTDRKVWGQGKLWQHTLTLWAEPGSERAKAFRARAALPQGKYLVRVYVDAEGKLAKDWTAELGVADFAGEAEVTSAWPAGYGKMTVVDGAKVKKP
jgi:hypothetical protein